MAGPSSANRRRASSGGSSSIRTAGRSIRATAESVMNTDPPLGMWAATAQATSQAPTLGEIRRGNFGHHGWSEHGRLERRRSSLGSEGDGEAGGSMSGARRTSSGLSGGSGRRLPRSSSARLGSPMEGPVHEERLRDEGVTKPFPPVAEEPAQVGQVDGAGGASKEEPSPSSQQNSGGIFANENGKRSSEGSKQAQHLQRIYTSGYIPPPHIPWTTSSCIGLKAFWKWFLTPFGFLLVLYGLNVVAWGGMLFLLLLGYGAAPAMCSPNTAANAYDGCNDINSPRRIWIEIDSQILNALFCVTGFGLIPWRFRDLYYLLRWRLCSEHKRGRAAKMRPLRVLAGFYRTWFRLPGSDTLDELSTAQYLQSLPSARGHLLDESSTSSDERLPLHLAKTPPPPLTGVRAPPTPLWKLDFFIYSQVANTLLQGVLCAFMWHFNRHTRPSWATGLFIALACIVAGAGGISNFVEGKRVKRVEGVGVEGEGEVGVGREKEEC